MTISIGNSWYSLVFITNVYIDMQKTADMVRVENHTFEEISEKWENFENEIINFVTRCKSFFDRSSSLK